MPNQRDLGLESLYAAVARAERTGHTDEDQKTFDLANKLGKTIINQILDYADQGDGLGGLDAPQITKVLAGVIATIMQVSAPDQMSSINLLGELNLLILEIILSEKPQ